MLPQGPANFLDGGAENGPLTFEVGAGDVVGNPLFEAMDGAVRGLSRGDVAEVERLMAPFLDTGGRDRERAKAVLR